MAEVSKSSNATTGKSAVIYLGRIPKEFEEQEMRKFFSQFGNVKRLRLSRNKKTGASKHYAFLEFETPEVAEIVVNTMNGYILFGHRLSCSIMEPDQIHETLWRGANREYVPLPKPRSFEKKNHSKEEVEDLIKKRLEKNQEHLEKLKEMGIEYKYISQLIKEDQKALKSFNGEVEEKEVEEEKEEVKEEVKEKKEKKVVRVTKRLSKQTKKLGK